MRANMHRRFIGRAAAILVGGVLMLAASAGRAQPNSVSGAIAQEIGSKDLGERGQRILPSLDLYDAELGVVLRAIAKFSGLNIISSDSVSGKVTLYLENVSVKSALDAILTTNGYAYVYKDNVVYVLPAAQLGEDKVKTITRVHFLQYLDAAEVEQSLSEVFTGGGGGSSGGSPIAANPSSNSIIITDTPDQVEKIVALLNEIDRPFKQVRIESRLLEMRYGYDEQIGIDWTYYEAGSPGNRVDINLTPQDYASGLTSIAGMYQFGLVRDGGKTLMGFLQAEGQSNNIKILANPSVTALHNVKAIIKITNEIPYVEANVSQGTITESVAYKETGITLEVTPRINDEGVISMRVKPTQRIAGARVILQNSNAFPIDERSVETELRVPDASTVVIGGLRSSETIKTRKKVPMLGDVPILGNLFKRRLDDITQTELLLFITPTVVKDFGLGATERKHYDRFDQMNEKLDIEVKKEEDLEAARLKREKEAERKREERELKRAREERAKELSRLEKDAPAPRESTRPTKSKPSSNWEGDWAVGDSAEGGLKVEADQIVSQP